MANTDLIIPIVVAGIGLLGTVISLLLSWRNERRAQGMEKELEAYKGELNRDLEAYKGELNKDLETFKSTLDKDLETFKSELEHMQTVSNLTEKYSQPLLVAAYDLQQRLYDLVEYPISRQHLSTPEGLDDLKIFTCYLLAQYLAYTYILRTKTGYLSFSKDLKLKQMRNMMYMIDEELDRRRDATGRNVGVWPAARILISERMIIRENEMNDALDGGFGVEVKGYGQFYKEWAKEFREPMGYFCEWIDLMLEGRVYRKPNNDAPMRCLQHLLVDLVGFLDHDRAYITQGPEKLKCNKSSVDCDCAGNECEGIDNLLKALKGRQDSRWNDAGIWSCNGLQKSRKTSRYDSTSDEQIDLQTVKNMTHTVNLT
ncbi:hypothetical protein BKA66DRAFT_439202 [Pyrenochaeta sp. MPI-SDFR-AT-0127]|nr:hypothetical protein BKA66DRAFT_439202 [Pyrenochaeta sp. MPI-SDFR-AT-0127]